MLNRVTIMGRLVDAPIHRETQSGGVPVANFSLAVERDYIKPDTKEREVDFIDVTAWRGLAEWAAKYLVKGQLVAVDGRLESWKWKDKDGKKYRTVGVTATDIYFGGPRRGPSAGEPEQQEGGVQYEAAPPEDMYQGEGAGSEESEVDDLPD